MNFEKVKQQLPNLGAFYIDVDRARFPAMTLGAWLQR